MVPVQKKSGGVRICSDFKRLNVAVKCEHYILQSVEDIMHCLKEANIFSKLDATSGTTRSSSSARTPRWASSCCLCPQNSDKRWKKVHTNRKRMPSNHLGVWDVRSLSGWTREDFIVTDQKTLVPLINTKDMSETPLRCQRMLMRLMRSNIRATYVPGKDMLVADPLSISLWPQVKTASMKKCQFVSMKYSQTWQVTDAGLAKIRAEALKDVNLKAAMEYTIHHSVVGLSAKRMFSRLLETSSSSELNLAFMMDCYWRQTESSFLSIWGNKSCKESKRATWQ